MNRLPERRRRLVEECDRDRERLARDLESLVRGIREVSTQAGIVGSRIHSATAFLAGAVSGFAPATPWLRRLLQGADLATDLWQAFRPRGGTSVHTQEPQRKPNIP